MKKKYLEIIRELRKSNNANKSEIARNLNLPISTVNDRIKKLSLSKLMKHSFLIDNHKMGYHAHTIVKIRVPQKNNLEILDQLKNDNCVNSLFLVNSNAEIIAECVFENGLTQLKWVENIKKIWSAQVESNDVIDVIGKEKFVPYGI